MARSMKMADIDFVVHSDPSALILVAGIVILSLLFMWFVIAALE
jgi:hypothetical protein